MSTKRILSLVLALVMVLGTFSTMVFAETGNDKVDWLVDQGILVGDEKGDLKLNATIDRASVAKLVVEALDLGAVAEGMKGYKNALFSDVPVTHWANGYINVVSARGIMIGDAGKFMPGNQISYAEILTILVRVMDGLTADEEKAAVWPTTYIAKANELGILEGVTVVSYQEAAIREAIFEMFYNAMTSMEVGNYTIVKAIVLENNRVEAIGKNEVVVEVIRELQRADYADESRRDKGDQERYTIDAKVGDVEELLGKVADFTLNKNGEVVKVKVDGSYTYYAGPVWSITRSKINNYTVELDERYRDRDERIFRTYHNDKAYSYADFDKDFTEVDYARVTVKNGKVLFIDAYTFEDIAPVKEVKRNGQDVYVYNDFRDAREEKLEPRALVIGFNDGVFSRIEREDIRANDVVHVYGRNRVIVRQDALVTGDYQKVERDRDGDYYAYISDKAYFIADANYFRPVYAHDSKSYTTLYTAEASRVLAEFYKEEVNVLVDMNDGLQLFGGDIQYNEGMAMIEQILARGQVKFVQKDNERLILDEDYTSVISTHNLGDGKTTTNQRLNSFNTRDLVFVLGAEDKIGRLVRIATEEYMEEHLSTLKSAKSADMNNSFIRLDNDARYQVLDRTNVFVINRNGSIAGTTVAKLQAGLAADSTVRAFILSDRDVTELINERTITDRNRITNEPNVAHTIVFMNVDYADPSTDKEVVLVDKVYTARAPHYILGIRSDRPGDNELVERNAAARVSLVNVNPDDIVRLELTKDDDKLITRFTDGNILIPSGRVKTHSYKVVGGDLGYSRYEYRRLVLEDAEGKQITKWLVRGVEEFGTITVDSVVTFHEDGNGDIDVIRVYRKGTKVTANSTEVEMPEGAEVFRRIFTLDGNDFVQLGDKTYPYVGKAVNFKDGDWVFATYAVVRGETVVTELKEAEVEEPTDPEEPEDPEELTLKDVQTDAVDETMAAFGLFSVAIDFDSAKAKFDDVTVDTVFTLTLEDGTVIELTYDADADAFANWDVQEAQNATELYNGVVEIKL